MWAPYKLCWAWICPTWPDWTHGDPWGWQWIEFGTGRNHKTTKPTNSPPLRRISCCCLLFKKKKNIPCLIKSWTQICDPMRTEHLAINCSATKKWRVKLLLIYKASNPSRMGQAQLTGPELDGLDRLSTKPAYPPQIGSGWEGSPIPANLD